MVQLHSRIRQSQSIQINTGLPELLAGLSEGGVVKIDAEKVDHPSPRISHEQSRGDHRVSLDGVTRVMGQIVVLVSYSWFCQMCRTRSVAGLPMVRPLKLPLAMATTECEKSLTF